MKKKQDYQQQSTGLESCLPDRPLLDITLITAELNTEYRSLFGVSVKTVSGNKPADIVVMLAVI